MKKKLTTLFRIFLPTRFAGTAREFADRFWDTYGFDFDTEHCNGRTIVAWPEAGDKPEHYRALKQALEAEGVRFTTFEVDFDAWCGLADTVTQ